MALFVIADRLGSCPRRTRSNRFSLLPRSAVWLGLSFAVLGQALATDPMRTVVVVNADSTESLTIANHYAALRSIPDQGIVTLTGVPAAPACSLAEFQRGILQPVLNELNGRGLAGQTDVITYSAGFPTAIDFSAETKRVDPWRKPFTPTGSLNGLTSLYSLLDTDELLFAAPRANFYARPDASLLTLNPFVGQDNGLWESALREAAGGEYASAINTAESLLSKHPDQWPIAYRRAEWLASSDRVEEAIAEFTKLGKARRIDRAQLEDSSSLAAVRSHPEYARLLDACADSLPERMPPIPFSGSLFLGKNGLPVAAGEGLRYLLSTCLAVTHPGRGNSVAEAIESLRRAASADGTGGTAQFFFSVSSDIRAQTRKPLVPAATLLLRELGHQVIIDRESLPREREELMGAMLGTPNYEWQPRGNTILPGGIVENLTSTSGVLHTANSQTPMTDLIRAGAAGTSGTVYEPFALQFKFPTPLLYVYYAAGCSLAEAFHLSVESPYQLLIIGDPLCRPYGDEHNEAFSLTTTRQAASTIVQPRFWRGPAGAARTQFLLVYLDGKLIHRLPPTVQRIEFRDADLPPGEHEVRIFAVSKHPLLLRTGQQVRFRTGDVAAPVAEASLGTTAVNGRSEPAILVSVSATGAEEIAIRHLGRRLRSADGSRARFEIPVRQTGQGPVRLIPEARLGDRWVRGESLVMEIDAAGDH